tara:strand:- start:994 stop:1557 length:564 start_codon:yes stop_codon:yes gene_type:complete
MKMTVHKVILVSLLLFFNNLKANEYSLDKNFISLKDFILLKFEIHLQQNLYKIIKGGGVMNIKYQKIKTNLNIDKNDNILITIDAFMDKKRYTAKRYFPKLKDCNQIRNKIYTNKYGYSLFTQKLNNFVNEETLTNSINENILNISSLNDDFKKEILKKTNIKIKIFHPKNAKSINCSGKLIDAELN